MEHKVQKWTPFKYGQLTFNAGKESLFNKWCRNNCTPLLVEGEKKGNSILSSYHTQKLTLDGLQNGYNNFIHNSQYLETTQTKSSECINSLVYPNNGLSLSHKKEQTIDKFNNMNESQKHHAKQRSQTQKRTHCIILFI